MAAFYADENFPLPAVEALRRLGHDVLTALEAGQANQRVPDDAVLEFATNAGRAVLTLDRREFVRLHSHFPNRWRDARRWVRDHRRRPRNVGHLEKLDRTVGTADNRRVHLETVMLVAAIQGYVQALLLWTSPRGRRLANRLFAALLVAVSTAITLHAVGESRFPHLDPAFRNVSSLLVLTFGPLLLFYARALAGVPVRLTRLLGVHLLPALVGAVLLFALQALGSPRAASMLHSALAGAVGRSGPRVPVLDHPPPPRPFAAPRGRVLVAVRRGPALAPPARVPPGRLLGSTNAWV